MTPCKHGPRMLPSTWSFQGRPSSPPPLIIACLLLSKPGAERRCLPPHVPRMHTGHCHRHVSGEPAAAVRAHQTAPGAVAAAANTIHAASNQGTVQALSSPAVRIFACRRLRSAQAFSALRVQPSSRSNLTIRPVPGASAQARPACGVRHPPSLCTGAMLAR
jgi:hypothetical protein